MALTAREKKLVLIMPAALVLAGYGLFPLRYQLAESTRLNNDNAAARAAAPSSEQILADQGRLRVAREAAASESKLHAAADQRWRVLAGKLHNMPSRPDRIANLNQLLVQTGLQLIDAGDLEGRQVRFVPTVDAAAREVTELAENQQPRRRYVRFVGEYKNVLKTLTKLAEGEVMAVPLGVTMKDGPIDVAAHEWTLVVWV